jgi:hypothetical protein
MTVIPGTSGRIHSEFVRLLFLQSHRETDRFFAVSGVHLAQPTSGQFHFLRVEFSDHLRSKIGNMLTKVSSLRITLNIDSIGMFRPIRVDHTNCLRVAIKTHSFRRYTYSVTISHSPITLANLSSINLVFIFRCSSSPRNPVYVSRVDPSVLSFSLSSHRHSYISFLFSSRFLD